MSIASDLARATLAALVKEIRIESNLSDDPLRIKDPFAESPPGTLDAAVSFAQPMITVDLGDNDKIVIAPAGKPGPQRRAMVKGAKWGTAAAVGGFLAWIVLRKRR